MSVRVDVASLIPGAVVVGDRGHGVLAENIPAYGESGYPSIAYPWLGPEDAGKEIRVQVTSPPAVGSLFVYEDTSFDYTGPSTSFEVQLYVDGAPVGTAQPITVVAVASELAAASVTHAHVAGSLTLTARHALTAADSAHTTKVAAPTLTSTTGVEASDVSHAHAAGSPTLTARHTLTAADSAHTTKVAAPTLTLATSIGASDVAHAHTAGSLTLTSTTSIGARDVAHAHAAGSPTLTARQALLVHPLAHGHNAQNPALIAGTSLAPQNVRHDHSTSPASLEVGSSIALASAAHAHTTGVVVITAVLQAALTNVWHARRLAAARLYLPVQAAGLLRRSVYARVVNDRAHIRVVPERPFVRAHTP